MKLRLQANSIRFRLKRGEVAQLVEKGFVEESIWFGPTTQVLIYRLETSENSTPLSADFVDRKVFVHVPACQAQSWAQDDQQVSIEKIQPFDGAPEGGLLILIEKDFACLKADDAQNIDTYPNPLADKAAC